MIFGTPKRHLPVAYHDSIPKAQPWQVLVWVAVAVAIMFAERIADLVLGG